MGILRTDKISGLETPTAVTGSVEFDGTGKAVSFPAGNDFAYRTGDFTIEGWFYPTVIGQVAGASFASHIFFGQTVSGTNYLLFGVDDNGKLIFYNTSSGGGSDLFTSAPDGSVVLNKWQHIALCRSSGTIRAFVDGLQVTSISNTFDFDNTDRNPTIGNYTHTFDTQPFNGYVSNFRILKGTALYTSDFTVPTHELEVIGDTVLLCCNNSDSAGAEATGKTATVSGSAPASTFSPGLTRDFTSGTEFRGVTTFDTQGYFVPPSGTTEQRGRGRGVNSGGLQPSKTSLMEFVNISSQGNAQDFGNLTINRYGHGSCASSTRGIFAGGWQGSPADFEQSIDSFTIATTGNAIDFGDFGTKGYGIAGCGSNTRGVFSGFRSDPSTYTNIIEYVTIASLGSAATFGGLPSPLAVTHYLGALSSPTRGVWAGGRQSPTNYNTIYYVTIASTGNAIDFGDLSETPNQVLGASSSVRGIFGGGYTPSYVTMTQYITIASTGNAQDFGDLTLGRRGGSSMSNSNRALFAGGGTPGNQNTIDFFTISTTGDATDFGDLTHAARSLAALSDSHGGLS